MAIGEAIMKLKRMRPIICVNPGFLAQLFLISCCGFDSAIPQLLIQNILKQVLIKTGNGDVAGDTEKKLYRTNYSDSYKSASSIDNWPTPNDCGDSICNSNESSVHIGVSLSDESTKRQCSELSPSLSNDSGGVTERRNNKIHCKGCKFILASEKDIVYPLDYSGFLQQNTDPYWSGYRAIHLQGTLTFTADVCTDRNTSHKKRKKEGRGNLVCQKNAMLESLEEKITAVGPTSWIRDQLEKSRFESSCVSIAPDDRNIKRSTEKQTRRDHENSYIADLCCPNCGVVCGYYRRHGLEICDSFVRCDLLALRASQTLMTNSTLLT